MSARQIQGAVLLAAYLVVMGFLGGMIVSAMRFDRQRSVVLSQLNDTSTRVRARLMDMEKDAARGTSRETTSEVDERH